MREMSYYYKLLNSSKPDDIYLFKGTHHDKLNEALKKSFGELSPDQVPMSNHCEQSFESESNINSKKQLPQLSKTKLNLRQPNLSLEMSHVSGIECYKRASVAFWK
jgi:hypothetical protein